MSKKKIKQIVTSTPIEGQSAEIKFQASGSDEEYLIITLRNPWPSCHWKAKLSISCDGGEGGCKNAWWCNIEDNIVGYAPASKNQIDEIFRSATLID